ncbi:MAG: ParB/RepB/Spo0J family partition protein [Clostridia bacterium]|nr:ParB/RepB/Spo0J family partition protein [Clostridia bacterium]
MFQQKQKPKSAGQIVLIDAERIFPNPNQPRMTFDYDALQSLALSVKENGLLQPLTVRPLDDNAYELISGERRLRACRIAGVREIPCVIVEASDEQSGVFALIENMQRADLSFYEEALAIRRLQYAFGFTQEELAKKLGRSQSSLSNKLRILRLPPDIIADLLAAGLTERHARALLTLDENADRRKALETVILKKLNVAETEKLVAKTVEAIPDVRREPVGGFRDLNIFVNTLNHAVSTMRKAGIEADSEKSETREYIEYVIRIPKTRKNIKAV